MRIAVINQYSSAGGGARFVRALVSALAGQPGTEITLFADHTAVDRDNLPRLFSDFANVEVRPMVNGFARDSGAARLTAPTIAKLRQRLKRVRLVSYLYYKVRGHLPAKTPWYDFEVDASTQQELDSYDIVYLAWPYFIEPFDCAAPIVMTPHDFNYKYPFGNFSPEMLEVVERQMPEWLDRAGGVVVSSQFIADELENLTRVAARDVDVVRLTHFSVTESTPEADAAVRQRLGIPDEYAICASNTSPHKNLALLLEAAGELKRRGVGVPVVFAGYGTDNIGSFDEVPKDSPLYEWGRLTRIVKEQGLVRGRDFHALGYVSDAEIDSLIRGAMLLVAPSRYEAGSGPAVDAWSSGTPVAMSAIPPFLEQLEFLGTKALLFDVDSASELAAAMEQAAADSALRARMAAESLAAISQRTWDNIAAEYVAAFEHARLSGLGIHMETAR